MSINAPGGTRAPSGEQSDEEKISAIREQIEKIARQASKPFDQIRVALLEEQTSEVRRRLSISYPELGKLLQLGSPGGELAVRYFFDFNVAEIDTSGDTPTQKLERYRALLVTFEKIKSEVEEANAQIVGVPWLI
ncbi:MAG: hypothetical protein AAB794_01685 [Patescibacteria group bacterium]